MIEASEVVSIYQLKGQDSYLGSAYELSMTRTADFDRRKRRDEIQKWYDRGVYPSVWIDVCPRNS